MGVGSSNAGHIVIEPGDENSLNVVHVSDDVVRRFRGIRPASSIKGAQDSSGSGDAQEKLKQQQAAAQQLKQELSRSKNEEKSLRERLNNVEKQLQARKFAINVDDKMKEAEAYYQEKFDEFMKKQSELQEESTSKFKENLDTFQQRYMKADRSNFCRDMESEVEKCYANNSSNPLRCAEMAKNFFKCVEFYNSHLEAQTKL